MHNREYFTCEVSGILTSYSYQVFLSGILISSGEPLARGYYKLVPAQKREKGQRAKHKNMEEVQRFQEIGCSKNIMRD